MSDLKQRPFYYDERVLSVAGGLLCALLFHAPYLLVHKTYQNGTAGFLVIFQLIFVFLGLFTTLPLLLSGLSNGLKSLLIGSSVALGIIFLFNPSLLGLNFLLYYIGPVFILVQRGLLSRNVDKDQIEWYPSGLLLANLIAYGIGLIILQSYLTDWAHETAQLQLQFTEQAKKLPSDQQLYYNQMSSMMLSFFPGIMAVSITGLQILLALFAQKILEHKNLNLRPMPRFIDISLPWWLWIALAFCGIGVVAFYESTIGLIAKNVILLLIFAFFLEGLSIIHAFSRKIKNGNFKLRIFYLFVIVFGWLIIIVALLAIFEPWLQLRQRFSKLKG